MSRLLRFGISALAASMLWLGPAASAMAAGPVTQTRAMDSSTCLSIIAALKQSRSHLSTSDQYILDRAGASSCRVQATAGHIAPTGADALAGCEGFWVTFKYSIYFGSYSFDYIQDHLNGGFCSNGSTVTRDWGPDCYVTELAVWGNDSNWCGNYRPSGSGDLQMGHNFDVWPYPAPWWKKYGYSRVEVYPDFGYSAWGSCCA